MLSSLVLASGNAGKIKEFEALFAPLGVKLISQKSLNIPDAPEPHATFVENALAKARHASALSGLPALADDSGLCVHALGGEPGVHSARYAQVLDGPRSDAANNEKLLTVLRDVTDRRAWYVAVLVLVMRPDDPQPVIAQANWSGEIVDQARGDNGFGYDPYFFLKEEGCCVAARAPQKKNAISPRGMAMRELVAQLRQAGMLA